MFYREKKKCPALPSLVPTRRSAARGCNRQSSTQSHSSHPVDATGFPPAREMRTHAKTPGKIDDPWWPSRCQRTTMKPTAGVRISSLRITLLARRGHSHHSPRQKTQQPWHPPYSLARPSFDQKYENVHPLAPSFSGGVLRPTGTPILFKGSFLT